MKPKDWPDRRWFSLYLLIGLVLWFGFGVVLPALGVEVSPASPEERAPWWRVHVVAASAIVGSLCTYLAMRVALRFVRAKRGRGNAFRLTVPDFWLRPVLLGLVAPLLFIAGPVLHAVGMLPMGKLEPVVFCTIAALMYTSFLAGDVVRHPLFFDRDSASDTTET